jgi:hypothetical protein
MKSPIIIDLTAINMSGNNSTTAAYRVTSKDEAVAAVADFKRKCRFRKYDLEGFAEHENGRSLTKKEKSWFEELEVSL